MRVLITESKDSNLVTMLELKGKVYFEEKVIITKLDEEIADMRLVYDKMLRKLGELERAKETAKKFQEVCDSNYKIKVELIEEIQNTTPLVFKNVKYEEVKSGSEINKGGR